MDISNIYKEYDSDINEKSISINDSSSNFQIVSLESSRHNISEPQTNINTGNQNFYNIDYNYYNINSKENYNQNNNDDNNNGDNNNNDNENINNKDKNGKYKNRADCLRKKLKNLVLNNFLEFINNKIINKKYTIKSLDYSIKEKTVIAEEKVFMYKTLGEIFSNTISKKFTTLTKEEREKNNIKNINILKQDQIFKNILDITFIQCLNHFIGKKNIAELNEMKTFEYLKLKDKNHEENLKRFANNYEELVLNTNERDGKKSSH